LHSDSGSHDYTANRCEAKNSLGLKVEKPDDNLYKFIKAVYDDISTELGFGLPFNFRSLARVNSGEYKLKKALIESISGGSNYFVTRGKISEAAIQQLPSTPPQQAIKHETVFEGWKYENSNIQLP
jgi:hypothetical protein